jgi:hypothetical protein
VATITAPEVFLVSPVDPITKQVSRPLVISPGRDSIVAITTVLFLVLLSAISLCRQNPPDVKSVDSSPGEFSVSRAMKHLEIIAQRPHPVGSVEHAAVRDYLVKELRAQGFVTEVQTATALIPVWKGEFDAGTIQNVIARLPGVANSKAVMLVAHYDSVVNSTGASDDGAGVAALLETLRALKSAPPLKNDVIFLFTDGEEPGLLGARAFAAEHSWAKEVGLVLNFEARGISGPSIMFETSAQNGWLIKEFAASAPHPIAHSLSYEIYRLLPNETDFTVFKKANLPGLNFAYINGLTHYHTALDSIAAIDQRSLQHHGASALALTRHFGNLDLSATQARDAVYFDLLGLALMRYSGTLILPLTILTTIAFVGLLVYGLRKRRLTLRGLIWGFVALLVSLIVAPLAVKLLWDLVLRFQDVAGVRNQGEAYESNLFFVSFVTLAVAITSGLYIFFRARATLENLTAGALLVWFILLWLAALLLPGASYLPTWLLLFNLAPLVYLLLAKEPDVSSTRFLVLLFLCTVPGLVLLVPLIYQTYLGLTLGLTPALIGLLILLLGLFVPHLKLIATPRRWVPPAALLVVSVGFLGAGIFGSNYDRQQPKLDTIFYGLNADTQNSVWATLDAVPDEWATAVFKSNGNGKIQRIKLPEFFGVRANRPIPSAQTDALPLAGPQLAVVSDKTAAGVRSLVLRVNSPRQAPVVSIYIDSQAEVQSFAVNGKRVDSVFAGKNSWRLRYYALPVEGIELALDVKAQEPLEFRVVDQSYGLPALAGKPIAPRPSGLIPSSYPFSDSTLVAKSFVF